MVALDQQIRSLATGNKLDGRLKTQALALYEQEIKFVMAQQPYESITQDLQKKYVKLGSPQYTTSQRPSTSNGHSKLDTSSNLSFNCTNTDTSGSDTSFYSSTYPTTSNNEKRVHDGIPEPAVDLWEKHIHMEWHRESAYLHSYLGHGLHNMGNTCFMNSVLQVMAHTPPLVNYLTTHHHPHNCETKRVQNICVICIMRTHVVKALGHPTPSGSFVPTQILDRMRYIMKSYIRGRQEDAHEFLRYLIDAMANSALVGHKKLDMFSKQTSVINKIFGGYYRNEITCLSCNEKSTTFDPFLDMSIEVKPMGGKLEDALSQFTKVEILKSDNAYKCQKCKKTVSAKKMYTIHRPPNVLTIQLKRFNHSLGKINAPLKFPDRLNLRGYMSEKHGAQLNYNLFGLIVHHGGSTHSGHYFAFVKNMKGDWHLMDDNRVCSVAPRTVLQQHAYLLFYMKASTPVGAVKPQSRPTPTSYQAKNESPLSPKSFLSASLPSPNVQKVKPMPQENDGGGCKIRLPQRPGAAPVKLGLPASRAPITVPFKPRVVEKNKSKLVQLVKTKDRQTGLATNTDQKASPEPGCTKPLVPYDDDSPSNSDPSSPTQDVKTSSKDGANFSYNVFEAYKVKESPSKDGAESQNEIVKDLYGNLPPPEKQAEPNIKTETVVKTEMLDKSLDTSSDTSKTEGVKTPSSSSSNPTIRLKLNLKQGKVEDLTPTSFEVDDERRGRDERSEREGSAEERRKRKKHKKKEKKKKKKEKYRREKEEREHRKHHSDHKQSPKKSSSSEKDSRRNSSDEEGGRKRKRHHHYDKEDERTRSNGGSRHSSPLSKRGKSERGGSDSGSHNSHTSSQISSAHSSTHHKEDTGDNRSNGESVKRFINSMAAGYGGAEVTSWSGGASVLSHHAHEEEHLREETRKRHREDNEFDAGRQKKIKMHDRYSDHERGGKHSNPFQNKQNYANKHQDFRKYGHYNDHKHTRGY